MMVLKQVRPTAQSVSGSRVICDEAVSEDNIKIKKPAFMAVANYDYVCFREFAIAEIEKYAKGGLTIIEFDVGHWPQLEKPEDYNDALDRWVTNTFKL